MASHRVFDLTYMEDELKVLFQRDVDLVARKGIETSRNYLRRKAILSSTQVIMGRDLQSLLDMLQSAQIVMNYESHHE